MPTTTSSCSAPARTSLFSSFSAAHRLRAAALFGGDLPEAVAGLDGVDNCRRTILFRDTFAERRVVRASVGADDVRVRSSTAAVGSRRCRNHVRVADDHLVGICLQRRVCRHDRSAIRLGCLSPSFSKPFSKACHRLRLCIRPRCATGEAVRVAVNGAAVLIEQYQFFTLLAARRSFMTCWAWALSACCGL